MLKAYVEFTQQQEKERAEKFNSELENKKVQLRILKDYLNKNSDGLITFTINPNLNNPPQIDFSMPSNFDGNRFSIIGNMISLEMKHSGKNLTGYSDITPDKLLVLIAKDFGRYFKLL